MLKNKPNVIRTLTDDRNNNDNEGIVTRVRFAADVKNGVSCKGKSYADVLKNNVNNVRYKSGAVLNKL